MAQSEKGLPLALIRASPTKMLRLTALSRHLPGLAATRLIVVMPHHAAVVTLLAIVPELPTDGYWVTAAGLQPSPER
jgi:hypothetical protein